MRLRLDLWIPPVLLGSWLGGCVPGGIGEADPEPNAPDTGGTPKQDTPTPSPSTPTATFVLVGSPNGQLYSYAFADGAVGTRHSINAGSHPSFAAAHPSGKWVYAVDESQGRAMAFAFAADGAFTALGDQPTGGNGPAHIAASPDGSLVGVANYGGGSIALYTRTASGALGAASLTTSVGANAHAFVFSGDNQHVYIPCLGANNIVQRRRTGATLAALPSPAPSAVTAPAGAGPRHLALAPNGGWAFVINETASSVSSYRRTAGDLTLVATRTSLPAGFAGNNTGAAIAVHPTKPWLYASNRGHNSVVHMAYAEDGTLTVVGHTSTGRTPRAIALDAKGAWLIVGDQADNTLSTFRVDPQTGTLTRQGTAQALPASPTFVGFIDAPLP